MSSQKSNYTNVCLSRFVFWFQTQLKPVLNWGYFGELHPPKLQYRYIFVIAVG